MTIGTGTFSPAAFFGFPRAYIYDFYLARNGDTIVQTGDVFKVTDGHDPNLTATFKIHPHFLAWSSKSFKIREIVIESYYQTSPGGTQLPLPYNLNYVIDSTRKRAGLLLGWLGLFADPQHFALEQQPPDYWLPKPLP